MAVTEAVSYMPCNRPFQLNRPRASANSKARMAAAEAASLTVKTPL